MKYNVLYIVYILGEVDENALDEDEESEIETSVSKPVMTAKHGAKWAEIPTSEHQVARHKIVRQRCGPNRNTNMLSNLDTFKLFFNPEIADIIISHTIKKSKLNTCNI